MVTWLLPVVEVKSFNAVQQRVVLVSRRRLKIGQQVVLRARLGAAGEAPRLTPLRVIPIWLVASGPKRWEYVAHLAVNFSFQPCLEQRRAEEPRGARRRAFTCRVVSSDLPGFVAVSSDLSRTGLQVKCQGSAQPGQLVSLRLETDLTGEPCILAQARVAWVRPDGREFRLGLQFVALDESSRATLEQLLQYLENRQERMLEHLTLDQADQYL